MAESSCPFNLSFKQHSEVLQWMEASQDLNLDFRARARNVHIWALVALAALARPSITKERRIQVTWGPSQQARFARAVGFGEMLDGTVPAQALQRDRTVRLQRVSSFDQIEAVAGDISRLVIKDAAAEDTRKTLYYILVEFLRNAVQHSQDQNGAVVGAQLMDKTREYKRRPVIQVAVGDTGIGVMNSLSATYDIRTAHQALVMAQQPWVSSQFFYGLRGGATNAGLGLYFISEMAKRAAGRFLIASRGGSILLQGDTNYEQHHHIVAEEPGFPGTIVVFELPLGEVEDYGALISYIQDTAKERLPVNMSLRWFIHDRAPEAARKKMLRISVRYGAENTARAQRLVNDHLLPRIARGEPIEFDFSGLQVCTQSYLHALLFLVVRAAFTARVPLYTTNASPAVVSSLSFLEGYALQPDTTRALPA